ncbi:MAG: amidohydrolase family protein, partial [Vicinamibacteria bacterium]
MFRFLPFVLALASPPEPANLAIVGGTLIDGHGGPPVHGATVLIGGRHIVAVGRQEAVKPPPGAEVIDATGMTILPGLIDVHVHLDILGHADYRHWHESYRNRYPEIMAIAARQLVSNGVTTVADLCGDPDSLRTTIERIESGDIPGPRVRASMGWIMNWPEDELARHHRRLQLSNVHTVEEARQAARRAVDQGATILKVHTGLTREQLQAISEEARANGLKVTGHVGDREDLLMRLDAGQNGIEHLYLGGPAETPSIHSEVIQKIVDRGAYVIPTNIQTMIQERAVEWPGWKDNPRARRLTPADIWS